MKASELEQQRKRIKRALPFKKYEFRSEEITIELLNKARVISAKIIEKYGDEYLPIFIRVQKEIELRKRQKSYKEIALQLSKSDAK